MGNNTLSFGGLHESPKTLIFVSFILSFNLSDQKDFEIRCYKLLRVTMLFQPSFLLAYEFHIILMISSCFLCQ